MAQFIEKPWGHENILQQDSSFVVKELFMKAGHSCSLQYHEVKREVFYVVSGKMLFHVGDKDSQKRIIMKPGAHYLVEPGVVHRMEAIEDTLYIECSTNHLHDVVRIEDNYGRA